MFFLRQPSSRTLHHEWSEQNQPCQLSSKYPRGRRASVHLTKTAEMHGVGETYTDLGAEEACSKTAFCCREARLHGWMNPLWISAGSHSLAPWSLGCTTRLSLVAKSPRHSPESPPPTLQAMTPEEMRRLSSRGFRKPWAASVALS